jgi:hypothetical protein
MSEIDRKAASTEVVELHEFFTRWFHAELPHSDVEFERLASALAPDFEMVVPSGALIDRSAVLAGVRGAYGQWRGDDEATIEVRNVVARGVGSGLVQVSYEEWQLVGGAWKGRRSTALLRKRTEDDDSGFAWLHVHETWLPDTD